MSTIDDLRQVRLAKIKQLTGLGIKPYPAQSRKDYTNRQILEGYPQYENKNVFLCGRIMSFRRHGAITFANIQDQSGSIQVFINKKILASTNEKKQTLGYEDLKLLDIGDFIEVNGSVGKTSTGEISILANHIKLLSKSIRPLPEKWQGIKDQELIFRRRYLDLTMNPSRKELFIRKSKFWELNRLFLRDHGFVELETPIMELVTGGADAKPFITHHNTLDQDFYLRISSELYQKRLISGGFEKIFVLGPNFRNEGIDDEHLQEYYQCEWYWAYADYQMNMDLIEKMFKFIATNLYQKTKFTRGKHTFDLSGKWPRETYTDLIKKRFSVDIFNDSESSILHMLKEQKIDTSGLTNRARIVDNLWKIVRQEISGPIFVIDEPKFTSPLAKSKASNDAITERFHVIIAGSELGNGYSELNDPIDQYERFLEQQKNREDGDEESQMMDIDFVEMLEYGMPPTSGYAHSERLFWFLENVTAREGTLFPQMKYEISEETKRIYKDLFKSQDNCKVGLSNNHVVIGQIKNLEKHPNADRLRLCEVQISKDMVLKIVCGANNIKENDVVPVALEGAIVHAPDNKTLNVQPTKMRGVLSEAMMCSPLELGLSDDHTRIYILPSNLKSHLGQPVSKYFKP